MGVSDFRYDKDITRYNAGLLRPVCKCCLSFTVVLAAMSWKILSGLNRQPNVHIAYTKPQKLTITIFLLKTKRRLVYYNLLNPKLNKVEV